MIRSIRATELKPGDVMALPFGKSATIHTARVGTHFVNIVTEHGPARINKYDEVLLEVNEEEEA